MSDERGFWAGAVVATHQDLSGLFVARCAELYLENGGAFGFVMPLAVLSRRQFAGFRTGAWSSSTDRVQAALARPWDLHLVKPSFFPLPACVVFGERVSDTAQGLMAAAETWSGRLPSRNATLVEALPALTRKAGVAVAPATANSPYGPRFAQGATLVPRVLLMVEAGPTGPLGAGAGRRAVHSRRSATEKRPWRDLPALAGNVERQFVHPVHVGDTVLPFRARAPMLTVIPWDGQRLLAGADDHIDLYPGLADWWRNAERLWMRHRSSEQLTLLGQIDYRRKLSEQLPASPHRVVYSKGGMYLAAARVDDPRVVIDHKLYWATAADVDEARYLVAVLNSDALLQLIRPLQARGEHNPRDFDKYVFRVPIPLYDAGDDVHRGLVALAKRAEEVAADVSLPAGVSFQALRRRIRTELVASGLAADLDTAVEALLASRTPTPAANTL